MKQLRSHLRRLLHVGRLEDRTVPAIIFTIDAAGTTIFRVDSNNPSSISGTFDVAGLAGETLQAIDFRPATGQLYALSLGGATARIGTINLQNGAFTAVGTPFTVAGTDFGFDFNPTNDRIRITSDQDINLLVDPNTGVVTFQGTLNPGNPSVVASAYTNNFTNATTTTLYAIDTTNNQLMTQVPATGALTVVGSLGIDPDNSVGFDIAGNGLAFVSANVSGVGSLYSINLGTGTVTSLGPIGGGSPPITTRGIAVARYVWDGEGGGPTWTEPTNWAGNIAPDSSSDLVFPAGAAQIVDSFNGYSPGMNFNSIVFTGNGYDIDGSGITLTNGITDSSTGGINDFDLDISLGQSQVFSVVAADQTLALGGLISGSSSFTLNKDKLGSTAGNAGTLLLNGLVSNTFGGTTNVNGGKLQLSALGTSTASINGPLVINSGAVELLANNQIADGAPVTVNAAGIFTLNGNTDSVGVVRVIGGRVITNGGRLTTNGDTSLDVNSFLSMQVLDAATSDRITVNGIVTVGGTLQLNAPGVVPTGSVIILIDNDGGEAINGTFANATEGEVIIVNGIGMTLSYKGNDGNDLTLTIQNVITGRVFEDINGNGILDGDPPEPGIENVRIYDDISGNDAFEPGEPFTFSNANGDWTLTFNTDGVHKIRQEVPANYLQTTPQPADITLTAGQTANGVNFGDFKVASISGTVFNDLNSNGVRDDGEPGMAGVTLQLDKDLNFTIDATTVSDANGFYSFNNLGSGTYRVQEVVPAGFQQTSPNPGNFTLTSGQMVAGANFGNSMNGPRTLLFAVGAGQGGGPNVKVYNSDGNVRFDFFAYDASFTGGVTVATGDVNGDGIDDIITGAGPGGGPHVKVFDGVNLALLRSFYAYDPRFTGGVNVAAGDFNGDEIADIVTGAGAGGGPHVIVYDGTNLNLLSSFFAYDASFAGGVNVAAGDVTGDGTADIATGAGPGGGPHVKVFDVLNNTTVYSFFPYMDSFMGGVSVAVGDTNRDGRADIITGPGFCYQPLVKIFSGATGQFIRLISPYDPSFIGGVRVGAIDLDGNGSFEVVTGAGPGGGPHVKVYRLDDASQVASFYAFDPSFMGGVFVG